LDAQGNFSSLAVNGSTSDTRTHNRQNQITSVTAGSNPTYDASGNTTHDASGVYSYVYDAWNRMRMFTELGGSRQTQFSLAYDALHRRIVTPKTTGSSNAPIDVYYNVSWQALEEREGGKIARRARQGAVPSSYRAGDFILCARGGGWPTLGNRDF
jgi:YD repeat-containing protein